MRWHGNVVDEPRKIQSRAYRLFDIQHAVLPTKLPLLKFYKELVKTQRILNMTHLDWMALRSTATIAAGHLWREQMNFVKVLWKFRSDIAHLQRNSWKRRKWESANKDFHAWALESLDLNLPLFEYAGFDFVRTGEEPARGYVPLP